jgi:DNA-binding MarR family transcriptional regulator
MKLVAANAPDNLHNASTLCLKQQLCFALYAASNQVTRLNRAALEPLGLTYPQFLVMMVLWETAPCTVSDIGNRLMLDSGTLTPLLKRMQANGLLSRTRDPLDERCVRISLSPEGRALKRRASRIPALVQCQINLPAATLDALREQLQALIIATGPTVET